MSATDLIELVLKKQNHKSNWSEFDFHTSERCYKKKNKKNRYENVNGYDTDGRPILRFTNTVNGNEHYKHCQSHAKTNNDQREFKNHFFVRKKLSFCYRKKDNKTTRSIIIIISSAFHLWDELRINRVRCALNISDNNQNLLRSKHKRRKKQSKVSEILFSHCAFGRKE